MLVDLGQYDREGPALCLELENLHQLWPVRRLCDLVESARCLNQSAASSQVVVRLALLLQWLMALVRNIDRPDIITVGLSPNQFWFRLCMICVPCMGCVQLLGNKGGC